MLSVIRSGRGAGELGKDDWMDDGELMMTMANDNEDALL